MADSAESLPKPVRRRESAAWVGVFLIVGILAVLITLFTMTEPAMFRGRYIIYTAVANAGGMRRGDAVQMRGVPIGRVMTLKISKEGVRVQMEIEGEYKIPKDSHVEIKSGGLMSGMVVDVVPGTADQYVKEGDVLPGSSGQGLGDITANLNEQVGVVLQRMQSLLSEETISNVRASSGDLAATLRQLNQTVGEQRRQIDAITASMRRSTEGLEKVTAGPELERSVKRIDEMTARMNEMSTRLTEVSTSLERSSKQVEQVVARIDRGEGTLGKLSRDSSLYDNLNQAARNANQATVNISKLTEEIRRDPKKYLKLSVF
jgi:phospholipid/cholesterol/gamma-HCH transport system substrate-binding protein